MTTAHETSDAFSDETLREQTVFQYAKEAEMKEVFRAGQTYFELAGLSSLVPSEQHRPRGL